MGREEDHDQKERCTKPIWFRLVIKLQSYDIPSKKKHLTKKHAPGTNKKNKNEIDESTCYLDNPRLVTNTAPFSSLTIAKQHSSAAMPSVEHLFLKHDLANQLLRRSIDQVANGHVGAWDREISHLLAHGLGGLGPPLRVPERALEFARGLGIEMAKNHPAHGVVLASESDPLIFD